MTSTLSKDSISKTLSQCKSKTIIVVGDVMLDEFHWCNVSRISPEAPVPVCRVENTTLVPGGAANVANNIQTLDSTTLLFGVVGKDNSGDKLLNIFRDQNINIDNVLQVEEKPTILKSRIIAHQQHVVRVDRENADPIQQNRIDTIIKNIDSTLQNSDAILISDYLKGTLTPELIQKVISAAKSQNKKVVIDPKGDDYSKYKGATILTPNFSEFTTIVKKQMSSEEEILTEGLRLIEELELDALLVTRSEKGMSLIQNGSKIDIPTQAKEVYDITGAGDTVISMLTIALASGLSFEDATYLANFAAGIVVGRKGTSTTTLSEIEDVFERYTS